MTAPFTDEETAYVCQFQPAGFLRTWEALYVSKCRRQWTLGRLTWAALEKRNRRPKVSIVRFDGVTGWEVAMPLGVGTLTVWGYRRVGG